MRRSTTGPARTLMVTLTALFALAVLGSGAGAATKSPVKITKVPGVGAVLATSDGHTLYTFTDASGDPVECTDACASAWPPYTVSTAKVKAPKGVKSLATDATDQLTWKGLPLYTFSGDSKAKTANGDGITSFGGTWAAATAKAAKAASSTPTTAKPSSGGSYSGY